MGVAGLYARRIFDLIQLEQCQYLYWRLASLFSPNDSLLPYRSYGFPAFTAATLRTRTSGAQPVFGKHRISPWGLYTARQENLAVAATTAVAWKFIVRLAFSFMRRCGLHPAKTARGRALISIQVVISSVTTPAPMGAFFRNEGRCNSPSLPRMEEGTQGVSLSFKEEVACGSGWFPLPGLDGLRSV